jgi:hypothetical protein
MVATTSAPTAIPNTPTETVVDGLAWPAQLSGPLIGLNGFERASLNEAVDQTYRNISLHVLTGTGQSSRLGRTRGGELELDLR